MLKIKLKISIEPSWVIATGHRPMYCTNSDKDDCSNWIRDIRRNLNPYF